MCWAAVSVRLGSRLRWWVMISGVFSVRILGGWKNSSGGRPSHSTIRRKFARSGRSPFSTRASVLKGTSLWAAAARRLRPSSLRRVPRSWGHGSAEPCLRDRPCEPCPTMRLYLGRYMQYASEQLDRNPAAGLPSTAQLTCMSPEQERRGAMPMTGHAGSPSASEAAVADTHIPGITGIRMLPDADLSNQWASIVLPAGIKEQLVRTVVAGVRLRSAVPFPELPLHGVMLLTGPPGTGKTTLARGLADKVARTLQGPRPWRFAEVDPHDLASSHLGRSQRGVSQLFGMVLHEQAAAGPLIVLFDEVETVFTDRRGLSLEANPIDVHRAV